MPDTWYDNKDIYEMMQQIKQDMAALREDWTLESWYLIHWIPNAS